MDEWRERDERVCECEGGSGVHYALDAHSWASFTLATKILVVVVPTRVLEVGVTGDPFLTDLWR